MVEPFDWNVVVAGAWNAAILTPAWIRRRMFDRGEGALLQVEVPLSGPGPMNISLEGIVVQVGGPALVVLPKGPTTTDLSAAAVIAANAVKNLPETPVSACGLNLRYRVDESEIGSLTACKMDQALAQAGQIAARELHRTVRFETDELKDGVVNVIVAEDEDGKNTVVFNFHRASNDFREIVQWLSLPPVVIGETVEMLLRECLKVTESVK